MCDAPKNWHYARFERKAKIKAKSWRKKIVVGL
jgi:hypothetical protein